MRNSTTIMGGEHAWRGRHEGEVHNHKAYSVQPRNGLAKEVCLCLGTRGGNEGKLGDDDVFLRKAFVGVVDVSLELSKRASVP